MNQLWHVVDDFIDILLRDACHRVGLHPSITKPIEWAMLLDGVGYNDMQRVHNIKMVSYVVHHLLNARKLTNSFREYFEARMKMPFKGDIILTTQRGKEITLLDHYKNKFTRFKSNFAYLTRERYKVTISKGENLVGGKGQNLLATRSHLEVLSRRRQKRLTKKIHQGRNFFLNYYMSDGRKLVKVW